MSQETTKSRAPALRIVAFAVGLVVLDRGLGAAASFLAREVTQGDGLAKINRSLERADAEIFVFGSSRALHHVDPAVLTSTLGVSAYNGGRDGQGILYARMLQALLFQRETKARLFLVQAEPMDLFEGDPVKAKMFAPFVDESDTVREILGHDLLEKTKLLSMTYRYNSIFVPLLVSLAGESRAPAGDDGFGPLSRSLEGRPPMERYEVAPNLPRNAPRTIRPAVLRQYRAFVEAAKARHVRVAFFTGPRYRRVAPEAKELEALEAYRALATELGAAFIEIDEGTHPELGEGRLYDDHNHLNREGARRFTMQLASRLRPLL